jgi:hypothetical protein
MLTILIFFILRLTPPLFAATIDIARGRGACLPQVGNWYTPPRSPAKAGSRAGQAR